MAGQFSDSGSRYALEAITGRSGVMLSSATSLTFGAAGTEPAANSATPVAFAGRTTITTATANGFAGLQPGMTVILTGNATAGVNTSYTVASVAPQNNQISITSSVTFGAGGTLFWNPSIKPTFLALCTTQPLDNNLATGVGQQIPLMNIQEYGATGYTRIPTVWSAATATNTGTGTVFVGNGTINGTSTVGPVQLAPTATTIVSGTATAVGTGTAGNPANVATITTASTVHQASIGNTVTLTGFTASGGATGTLNGTYLVTGVPSATTFTVATATGGTAPTGTFTSGTVTIQGPVSTTFTLYTSSALGVPTLVTTNPFVIGSTVNIRGASATTGNWDEDNATIVATTQDATAGSTITVNGPNLASGNGTIVAVTPATATTSNVLPNTILSGATGAAVSTSLQFTTYVFANSFAAGDSVLITGITTTTAFNGIRQVFAADSTRFTVFEPVAVTSNVGIGGTANISRVGAAVVGAGISGPTTLQTFGPFTAGTGSTITHAALVSQGFVTANIASIQTATPAANYSQITTSAAHGLFAGQVIRITGATTTGYNNGIYTILSTPSTTTFVIASTLGAQAAAGGVVSGVLNGEVLAWWGLDSSRTPAVNDSVTVAANALSLFVN
jgi:hypothetical protein